MGIIDLVDYENRTKEAIKAFWRTREESHQKNAESGKPNAGNRGSVTAGKHMDGFVSLIVDIIKANGLSHAHIYRKRRVVTLPGYFRPTKEWDLLVINERRLIAAIELKSQVGSFSNNFNNRAEEAIGSGHDLKVAYREGAFGKNPKPFVGWLMLAGDDPESRAPVREFSPHFQVFPEFQNASYLERYNILCQKLTQEELYTTASIIASPKTASATGDYSELHQMTGLKTFFALFAGHIAAEAARGPLETNRVPFYDLKAAAGTFSELQQVENNAWVNVPDDVHLSDDLFACKVVGESMNEIIPNGSICLFKKYSAGSREGLIVLVQHASLLDPEMGAGYTVKKYHSTKKVGEDGQWSHETITLSPASDDPGYQDITLEPTEEDSLKVIGVFVRVLEVGDEGIA